MRRYLVLTIIPAVFVLDQWTKLLILEKIPYLGGIDVTAFFSVVHVRNLGGAFGFLSRHGFAKYIFTILPFCVMAVLVFILLRYRLSLPKRFALALILSGAIGNMYDRLVYGYVVDFLDFFYGRYHWPAFNVADIAVSTGICLWLFVELFPGKGKTAKP
jgi:signal peptidase II